jgi:hypothetical protein
LSHFLTENRIPLFLKMLYAPHHDRQLSGARVDGSLGLSDRPHMKARIPQIKTRRPSATPIQ